MTTREDFARAGFAILGTEAENPLLAFITENYPGILKDGELNLQELKAALNIPVDEKINGYGLNFIGRNVGRAKYRQDTAREMRLNTDFSKNTDTTGNLVLKGDNLDSLKILKQYYREKIKCIYIDPPYNTTSDEFVYPDRFNEEEAEVLGLANLDEDEMGRLEFSFKSKKSHNGWLSFMYPRLLLARDLLTKDGVIFISIDDNEQANLKLLCDDIFGEENFVGQWNWFKSATPPNLSKKIKKNIEYILCYQKGGNTDTFKGIIKQSSSDDPFTKPQNSLKTLTFPVGVINYKNPGKVVLKKGVYGTTRYPNELLTDLIFDNQKNSVPATFKNKFIWTQQKLEEEIGNGTVINLSKTGVLSYKKAEYGEEVPPNLIDEKVNVETTESAGKALEKMFGEIKVFDYPKPISLLKYLIGMNVSSNDIILDFFAGSGTTGHAVMQLNAEDGGNRRFILCQIDEPIKKDKPAYKFCQDNDLPPYISSITIERLNRAGEKIKADAEAENARAGLFEDGQKQVPDIGYKVFDTVEAPRILYDEQTLQAAIDFTETDALSRIYNMVLRAGKDDPAQTPETVKEGSIYRIGSNTYITNSAAVSREELAEAVRHGSVFIDGYTATLNATMMQYKDKVGVLY